MEKLDFQNGTYFEEYNDGFQIVVNGKPVLIIREAGEQQLHDWLSKRIADKTPLPEPPKEEVKPLEVG